MPITVRFLLFAFLATLPFSGCGQDREPTEPAQSPPIGTGEQEIEIPPEELYGVSAVDNLWSPRVELQIANLPPGWNGVRIAVLSDFLISVWDDNEEIARAAIERAVQGNPDLVVLLGDFISSSTEIGVLERVLAPLRGRAGVLAVLGTRDIASDSLRAKITATLRDSGIQLLANTAVPMVVRGDTGWIAGLDPELIREPGADQEWVVGTLGVAGRTPLLLTHNPALATRAPTNRFGAVLAGHTFCGEVEVPGTPRLSWLREQVLPGARVEGVDRLFVVEGSVMFVTCGLGYSFVPLRFGAAPEVPVVTLVGIDLVAPPEADSIISEDSLISRFQGGGAEPLSPDLATPPPGP